MINETVVIGSLACAISAVCGYFVRKEKKQDESNLKICTRLDRLEDSTSALTSAVATLTTALASLTVTIENNAKMDEEQNRTASIILDRALNCQKCIRGPIHESNMESQEIVPL